VLEVPALDGDSELVSELPVEPLVELLALALVELLVELLFEETSVKTPLFTYQGELSFGKSEPDAC
jgi:hypothetical protein